jgi:lipid II:glycine glycyltransferase (peptidoglycan interpeptide bridge formation enzyme)
LYRHGGRLSTVHSGDHAGAREDTPGALHLLRWRAIELAIREGCTEMDLGGVDVAGARHEPAEGDPLYGLYQHKTSFGGRWLALTGAHERVYDARGYAAGRLASRLGKVLGR